MKEELLKDIGRRIREKRQESGLSQGELADAFGCAQSRISAIENGSRDPGVDFLVWFSEKTGVSTNYVLLGSGPSKGIQIAGIDEFIGNHVKRLMKFVVQDHSFSEELDSVIRESSPIKEPGCYWLTGDELQLIDLLRRNPSRFNEVFNSLLAPPEDN